MATLTIETEEAVTVVKSLPAAKMARIRRSSRQLAANQDQV
jgi:hypothetical protein